MNAIIWIVAFGITGFTTATVIMQVTGGEEWAYFTLFAGLASMFTSAAVWAVFSRGIMPGIWRGAGMGALTGVLSHPVTWYLASLHNFFTVSPVHTGSEPLDPISALAGSVTFSLWSLLLTGWLTIPVAAGLGALYARIKRENGPG
jgi:hypothetical protein